MEDFVYLVENRHRGWPWPEESWGMTPMFGESGWCRSCGVPNRPQLGGVVLSGGGSKLKGVWVPNLRFDAFCVGGDVVEKVSSRFGLNLLPVGSPRSAPGGAMQIVVPTLGEQWYGREELEKAALRRHRTSGALCLECGTWRWMPLPVDNLPHPLLGARFGSVDVAGSPEWFGDGMQSFRQILFRRSLAEILTEASPREFEIAEIGS